MLRCVAVAILVTLAGCRDRGAAARVDPSVDPSVVAITVQDAELGAAAIESAVTKPIEEAIAGMPAVRSIRAESRSGVSLVVAELSDDTAWLDARRRLEAIRARLPDGALPVLSRVAPDAPLDLVLAIGGTRTPVELTDIAREWIRPRIERLPGVGEVRVLGGQERRLEVRIDPARLDAMGLTVLDVAAALTENRDVPAGQLESGDTVRVVERGGAQPEQLRMRVVGQRGGAPIRVGDVATLEETAVPAQATPLQLGIRFQRGADRARLASQIVQVIQADVPSGVSITTVPPAPPAPRVTLIGDDPSVVARAAGDVARALAVDVPHEPTVEISIDRERAAALGVSPADLTRTIAVALGEPIARAAPSLDVVVQVPEIEGEIESGIEGLRVRTTQGTLVMLTSLVTRRISDGEPVRLRIDRRPAVELAVPGTTVAEVRRRVAAVTLPAAVRLQVR